MSKTLDYNDVLQAADFESEAIYTNYSGRYMYGATCFGFVGGVQDYTRFVGTLLHLIDADEWQTLVDALTTDNMGLDMIYYFPGWTLTNVPEDTDE